MKVVWTRVGSTGGLIGKLFGLVMDFEAQVGGDFEKGLARLAKVAER